MNTIILIALIIVFAFIIWFCRAAIKILNEVNERVDNSYKNEMTKREAEHYQKLLEKRNAKIN
jgi:hypothetical protein